MSNLLYELEFLENWLQYAETPIGLECCGHSQGLECCGDPVAVYLSDKQVIEQMINRYKEIQSTLLNNNKRNKDNVKFIHQYTKKPINIEAVKFEYNPECITFLKEWMGNAFISCNKDRHMDAIGWIQVGTLEDGSSDTAQAKHIATEGDYVIKGVCGEFYPCKPHIFEETYQLATYELVDYVTENTNGS